MERYDFGGAEYPYDTSITVVDNMPLKEWVEWKQSLLENEEQEYKNEYVEVDISRPGLELDTAKFINVSKVLKYVSTKDGFLYDDGIIRRNGLLTVVDNIDNNLSLNGTVRLFDHLEVMALVISELILRNYEMKKIELINPRDEDYPAEWEVILRKKIS